MSTDVGSVFSHYLALQRLLAPSYVDDASVPPFPGAPVTDADLTALAGAIGPVGPELEAILRVADGVGKFDLFSVDLRSAAQLATERERDTQWLGKALDEIIEDVDDDPELQAALQALRAASPVVLGASTARADLVLLHRASPDADWMVSQLVNNHWWELPENTWPSIQAWLEALTSGATENARGKGLALPSP